MSRGALTLAGPICLGFGSREIHDSVCPLATADSRYSFAASCDGTRGRMRHFPQSVSPLRSFLMTSRTSCLVGCILVGALALASPARGQFLSQNEVFKMYDSALKLTQQGKLSAAAALYEKML